MASTENNNASTPTIHSLVLRESALDSDTPAYQPSESTIAKSHSIDMTIPKTQGQLGVCTTFAVAAIVEHAYRNEVPDLDLSEAYFTVYVESQRGQDGKAGLSIADGMKYAKNYGFIKEEYWKFTDYYRAVAKKHGLNPLLFYNDKQCDKFNSGILVDYDHKEMAQHERYKLSKVEVIFNRSRESLIDSLFHRKQLDRKKLRSIKQLLANEIPIVASVPVYGGNEWDTGVITKPHESKIASVFSHMVNSAEPGAPQEKGWHAIVLCGYDDDKKLFKFKNSWGKDWGQGGFGQISYDYIKDLCDIAMYGTK